MKTKYCCDAHAINDHYMSGGGLNVFQGRPYQIGHGLGGLFTGLIRSFLPIFKKAAVPIAKKVLKNAGREILKTGIHAAKDVLIDKQNLKDSLRKRGKTIIPRIIKASTVRQKPKKRKNLKKIQKSPHKKIKFDQNFDIFDSED